MASGEVVDGLQRLSTVLSFFGKLQGNKSSENNWRMGPGDIVVELEGNAADDLPLKFQLNIKRSPVRIEVVKWDSKYDMRYELFNRKHWWLTLDRSRSPKLHFPRNR